MKNLRKGERYNLNQIKNKYGEIINDEVIKKERKAEYFNDLLNSSNNAIYMNDEKEEEIDITTIKAGISTTK